MCNTLFRIIIIPSVWTRRRVRSNDQSTKRRQLNWAKLKPAPNQIDQSLSNCHPLTPDAFLEQSQSCVVGTGSQIEILMCKISKTNLIVIVMAIKTFERHHLTPSQSESYSHCNVVTAKCSKISSLSSLEQICGDNALRLTSGRGLRCKFCHRMIFWKRKIQNWNQTETSLAKCIYKIHQNLNIL